MSATAPLSYRWRCEYESSRRNGRVGWMIREPLSAHAERQPLGSIRPGDITRMGLGLRNTAGSMQDVYSG